MKITQNKSDDLKAVISVEVKSIDYSKKVDKVLKDYQKTVQVSGFRKGKTPIGIINKKYRKSVVFEEVNKLIQDELYKYITDHKLKVLGSPLPIEQNTIDWENSEDFLFKYEIGLAPDFEVNITSKDKLDYFKIHAENKNVNDYCLDIAKKYGKMTNPEVSIDGDLVFCNIAQLDVNGKLMHNGIKNDATVSMNYISDKEIRNQFIGVKKDDLIVINVTAAFTNSSDLAAMLNVNQQLIRNLTSEEFQFTVKNINRLKPAELNIELFDKVYGPGIIKTEKEFKSKVKEDAEAQFVSESDRMLKNDVVNYLVKKLKLDMPNDFLKRWLIQTSKQPITNEVLDKEYDMYAKSLQWQLIENKILEKYQIKVTKDDALSYAKNLISLQMKQYGQSESDDEKLTEIATNVLQNEDQAKKLYDQIYDQRTLDVYKANFKLQEKSISYDEFVKLASEK